jgi:hypothetical protein
MFIEKVDQGNTSNNDYRTDRIAVPGGWIYRTIAHSRAYNGDGGVSVHTSMLFVPDAEVGRS